MRTRNETSLPNEQNNDAIREICSLLAKVQDEQLIYDFFGCLLTKAELQDAANRWHIVKELSAGTTQREIVRKYNMSLCNITRGSRELKKEGSAFKSMLKLLSNEE